MLFYLPIYLNTGTCPGFILAGAENNIRVGRKKLRWGTITPEGHNFFLPPPAYKILPLGQNRQEGGRKRKREKHLIIENRGREPN